MSDLIGEFLLHPPFVRRIFFCGLLGCFLFCGIFGVSIRIECLEGWKGILLMFGAPHRFHVYLWISILKTFCSYSIDTIWYSWSSFFLLSMCFCMHFYAFIFLSTKVVFSIKKEKNKIKEKKIWMIFLLLFQKELTFQKSLGRHHFVSRKKNFFIIQSQNLSPYDRCWSLCETVEKCSVSISSYLGLLLPLLDKLLTLFVAKIAVHGWWRSLGKTKEEVGFQLLHKKATITR